MWKLTDKIVDEVDIVVGYGIVLDFALKHSLVVLSRKILDEFSILDCMCWNKVYSTRDD